MNTYNLCLQHKVTAKVLLMYKSDIELNSYDKTGTSSICRLKFNIQTLYFRVRLE